MNRLVPTATEGAASNRRSREAARTDGEAEATGTGNAATISAQRRDMKQVLEFMNSSDEAAKRAKIEAKYSEESKNVGQAILARTFASRQDEGVGTPSAFRSALAGSR